MWLIVSWILELLDSSPASQWSILEQLLITSRHLIFSVLNWNQGNWTSNCILESQPKISGDLWKMYPYEILLESRIQTGAIAHKKTLTCDISASVNESSISARGQSIPCICLRSSYLFTVWNYACSTNMTFGFAVQWKHYFKMPYIKTGLVDSWTVRNTRKQM